MRPPPIDLIRQNMRKHGTGRTAFYAKRFKPFVMADTGYTVHRTAAARVDFRTATRASLTAYYACKRVDSFTMRPVFLDSPDPPHTRRCVACFPKT